MPEIPGQAPAPMPTAEEVAAHNEEVKAKLAAQDAAANPKPDPLAAKDAGDALDALLKQAEKKAEAPAEKNEPVVEKKDQTPVEPKTETDPAAKAAAEEAAKKETAEKAAKDEELKKAEDLFKDAPQLPQGASVKSHEAFSAIKIKSAQEISRLSTELETLRKELSTFKESQGKPSPEQEQLRKENEDLKQWRAKLDVEFDPKFKAFDQEAEQGREFIYNQLTKAGISEKTIAEIKKYGGPDKIQIKPVLDAVSDTTARRLVEATLADIEKAKYKKEQAIVQTKENISQYMSARQEELSKATETTVAETKKQLDELWNNLDWTKPLAPKQGATAEEKAQIENHNKFTEGVRKELETALADNSPKMKATLLTAAAQLFNLQEVHRHVKSRLEALEKENTELKAFKDKVKSASRSRLPESQAPASGAASLQKPVNIFNTAAGDGLDAAAKQVMAERAARSGQ